MLPELGDDQRALLAQVADGKKMPDDEGATMQLGTFKRLGLVEHERDDKGDHYTLTDRGRDALDADDGKGDASPEAQAKAAELGVDLSQVEGTGKDGRVTVKDVKA